MAPRAVHAVAEAVALAVVVLAGVKLARAWYAGRAQTAAWTASLAPGLARPNSVLGALWGVGLGGHPVAPQLDSGSRVVLFLLRRRSDLAFWNTVASALGGNPEVQFHGFCYGAECSSAAHSPRDVVVLQAGGLRTVQAVLQADRRAEALLVDAHGEVIRLYRWRDASPATVAAEIAATR